MNIEQKQNDLISDLWAVYYGNPLCDDNGSERDETYEQVLARALIAVLTSIKLPEGCEVPE